MLTVVLSLPRSGEPTRSPPLPTMLAQPLLSAPATDGVREGTAGTFELAPRMQKSRSAFRKCGRRQDHPRQSGRPTEGYNVPQGAHSAPPAATAALRQRHTALPTIMIVSPRLPHSQRCLRRRLARAHVPYGGFAAEADIGRSGADRGVSGRGGAIKKLCLQNVTVCKIRPKKSLSSYPADYSHPVSAYSNVARRFRLDQGAPSGRNSCSPQPLLCVFQGVLRGQ